MEYALFTTGWILYFALHSILAAEGVKKAARSRMGSWFGYYRLIYSLISTGALAGLFFWNAIFESPYFFERNTGWRYLSLLLATFGVITIQLAFRQFRFRSFIGFTEETVELKTEGILKVIRHPILAGVMLITIGFFLFVPNLPTLISCVCIMVYIPVGMYLEEKKLFHIYGEAFLKYKTKVPALIPDFRSAD